MNGHLSPLQADYIRQLYLTGYDEPIKVRHWHQIHDHALEACTLIAPTLSWPDTRVVRIIVSNVGVSVIYWYHPKGKPEEWKKSTAKFRYDTIGDPMLWQYLLHLKYPVPIFVDTNHPLNGCDVIEMGLT